MAEVSSKVDFSVARNSMHPDLLPKWVVSSVVDAAPDFLSLAVPEYMEPYLIPGAQKNSKKWFSACSSRYVHENVIYAFDSFPKSSQSRELKSQLGFREMSRQLALLMH